MKRCSFCLMAETKPGVVLDGVGVCQACRHFFDRDKIDWPSREAELKALCDKYRKNDGSYDCIIPVSGGKDSYFQTYKMKREMGMHPLLVLVSDPFTKTEAGKWNLRNMREVFDCDIVSFELSPALCRRLVRAATIEFGSPTWPIDRAIYVWPIRYAIQSGIKLIVYGENVAWEYGGVLKEETFSAKDQFKNDVAKIVPQETWTKHGITEKEMKALEYPTAEEIEVSGIEPVYLSYFLPWDGWSNYALATKCGFRDLGHEWNRQGYIDDYDQIDSIGYLINPWFKFPKFGFARTTDVVGYWRRSGLITYEQGKELIEHNDSILDRKILDDFLAFAGFTHEEFWKIAEKFQCHQS